MTAALFGRPALGGALLLAFAALARPLGTAAVIPLLIAASACWLVAALRLTGSVSPAAWWATFGSFAVRWLLAIGFYCASLYQWPLGRSLQVGNGFWLFCMDALNYHTWAPQILNALVWGLPLPDPGATIDYYLLVAITYGFFGTSPLTAIAFNIFSWTLAVVLLVGLFARLRGAPPPGALVGILSFWPSGLIWPTQLMKDSLVLLSLVLAVGAGVLLIESVRARRSLASVALLWLALIPLIRLRVYDGRILFAAALTAVAAGTLLWIARRARWRSVVLSAAVAVIAYFAVSTITGPDPVVLLAPRDPAGAYLRFADGLRARGQLDQARTAYEKARTIDPTIGSTESWARSDVPPVSKGTPRQTESWAPSDVPPASKGTPPQVVALGAAVRVAGSLSLAITSEPLWSSDALSAMSPDQLGVMRQKFAATGGDSATGVRALLRNWDDARRLIPVSIATGLFAPFPWDLFRPRGITGQFRTVAVSESLLMLVLLPAIALGLTRLRRPEEILVAALAAGGLLAVSLVITNLGTLFRLRVGFTLILVAFAAYGFDVYAWAASLVRPARRATLER